MAVEWKKTRFRGVRYREHKTRKHGGNPPYKCFSIRYKLDGHDKEEVVGWSSEGVTAESASQILAQLYENARKGSGPRTLRALRAEGEQREELKKIQEAQRQSELISFSQFWESDYFPYAKTIKSDGSIQSEHWLYTKWISPAIGQTPMQELSIRQLENLVAKAKKAAKSAATIRYILAVISQVWKKAEIMGIVQGDCPSRKVKKPREDNRRMRFLTQEEAKNLLENLSYHSKDMHAIAFLSLHTGMRAGEIHALTWGCIDFADNTIKILDTKSKMNRHAFMVPEVKSMLESRYEKQGKNSLVFPNKFGQKRRWVSDTFDRVVNQIGLNDSGEFIQDENGNQIAVLLSDARQKVVFHTLRHCCPAKRSCLTN